MPPTQQSSPTPSPACGISLQDAIDTLPPIKAPAFSRLPSSQSDVHLLSTSSKQRQTQHSSIAKSVMGTPSMKRTSSSRDEGDYLSPPLPQGISTLSDTPETITPSATAPSSPRMRATSLDVPGLTKSKISPDGRIANRDIGSKLVIIMVGLPARGKSYCTKKLARYLNWLQHDTRIFNVGNRRRVAASTLDQPGKLGSIQEKSFIRQAGTGLLSAGTLASLKASASALEDMEKGDVPSNSGQSESGKVQGGFDQSAAFFDPNNKAASALRERVAIETLDELLRYVLYEGGSVGILDATNSTLERRAALVEHIRQVAGNDLGVLFLESECNDEHILASNMRLKLSNPDYKGTDPVKALEDFKKRVEKYEKSYVPLGDFEERTGMPYIKMIDVGRKLVTHRIRGFLAAQTVSYLLNFHLSPRLICVTRHGESMDNVAGRIGGDAPLSENGQRYARALATFMDEQRKLFHTQQVKKHQMAAATSSWGVSTPPNPEYTDQENPDALPQEKNFCVWTSWLRRTIETAQYFSEDDYDIKQMKMLNELNAGVAEGLTYDEIKRRWPEEYAARVADKLQYRYTGAGGESYLDVIARLKPVISEVERMQDHVLLVTHRVVARVLLAYFLGLERSSVAKLDVPLGMLYVLEPKPYGTDFHAYRYDADDDKFVWMPDYQLKNDEQKNVKYSK